MLQASGVEVQSTDLLHSEAIELAALPLRAFNVRSLDSVPGHEVVCVELPNAQLAATLIDKVPRLDALSRAISMPEVEAAIRSNPGDAARDLARLLVDPNPEFGVVLESIESVPTTYESSDVYRDLRKAGGEPAEIRKVLLEPLTGVDVRPPAVERARLRFFTWAYFDGEVKRWTVAFRASRPPKVSQKKLKSAVGSYDLWM